MLRILFFVLATTVLAAENDPMTLYQQGVDAETIGERESAFEGALEAYISQYNQQDEAGQRNGYLCYNIANCYYNLGQLGEAVLFYRQALALLPGDPQVQQNLATALADRENAYDLELGGIHQQLFFFHYKWSLQHRTNAVALTGLLAAALLIATILLPGRRSLRYAMLSALGIFAVLGISLAAGVYAPQRVGVLVSPAEVRQGTGEGFAPILPTKLGSGSSIQVTGIQDDWYEVRLNDGRRGYVHADDLRLVL